MGVPSAFVTAIWAAGVIGLAAGCGFQRGTASDPPPAATPTLRQDVIRAEMAGPGFLNFCPTRSGIAKARYSLTLPGGGEAGGWCRTLALRRHGRDMITFTAFWDATRLHAGSATLSLQYAVSSRPAQGTFAPAVLLAQSGTPPP